MFHRLRMIALTLAAGVGVSACAYGDYGYGGVGVGVGYGGGYGGYYDDFYGGGLGGGAFGNPYWGWFGDYYYPGTGYYVYDRYRRPFRWNNYQRDYWLQRRGQWRGDRFDRPRWDGWNRPGFDRRPGYQYVPRGSSQSPLPPGRGDWRGRPDGDRPAGYWRRGNGQPGAGRDYRRPDRPNWGNDRGSFRRPDGAAPGVGRGGFGRPDGVRGPRGGRRPD